MNDKLPNGSVSGSSRPTPAPVRRALADVSDDVRSWRKLRGLTQKQLVERAGVTHTTLRRLEHGQGGVSLENFLRILRALGVVDSVHRALDPYESDIGRLRADELLPQRVRPKDLTGQSNG